MNTRLVIFLTFFVLILISGCASIELEAVRADARALERQAAHLWSRRHELVKNIKEIQDWLRQPSASVQERAAQQVEIQNKVTRSSATLATLQEEFSQLLVRLRDTSNRLGPTTPNEGLQRSSLRADIEALIRHQEERLITLQRSQRDIQEIESRLVSTPVVSQPVPSTPSVSPALQAQHRRALVIGNASYPESPLTNPVNDATDLAALLRRLGFDVTLHQNAERPTMEKAVALFTSGVPSGSVGLFFFAGHGVQIDGANYLLPIGARLDAASDIKYHAVAADWILARMDENGMDVKLLFLDACRNNPLGRSWTRALDRG